VGIDDKISNKAEDFKGKGKEAGGRATGDPELQAEGKIDQKKAGLKDVGEKVKDVFKK
jgi:uncharacterized protein YjbJ (UPF0337 family)